MSNLNAVWIKLKKKTNIQLWDSSFLETFCLLCLPFNLTNFYSTRFVIRVRIFFTFDTFAFYIPLTGLTAFELPQNWFEFLCFSLFITQMSRAEFSTIKCCRVAAWLKALTSAFCSNKSSMALRPRIFWCGSWNLKPLK